MIVVVVVVVVVVLDLGTLLVSGSSQKLVQGSTYLGSQGFADVATLILKPTILCYSASFWFSFWCKSRVIFFRMFLCVFCSLHILGVIPSLPAHSGEP